MIEWFQKFWHQPSRNYRNFQIVYTILTLNFLFPAISYYVDRDETVARAEQIGRLLGSGDLPASEESHLWWILGAGNVATLAFMCGLMQFNLRRYRPALPALVFLKMASAIGFGGVFLKTRHRLFAAATLLDSVSSVAMVYFANRAYQEIEAGETELVPQPIEL